MSTTTQNVAAAIQKYLESVKTTIGKINDSDGNPIQIPNYADLYTAAGKLDTVDNPTEIMYTINSLLGRANNVGSESVQFDNGQPTSQLSFPQDHALHPKMGSEWYWIGCHLDVTDENGNKGKLSIMDTMQKIRSVGTDIQAENNWTDEQVALTCNIATVTVKMDANDETSYYRRTKNQQWGLKGGTTSFSKPGDAFSFISGADSLTGSIDVLPLRLVVNDGDNMQIDITLTKSYFVDTESSFFLQGMPTKNGGTGFTPLPTPGMYYSWPQVQVTGIISVGGKTYKVDAGTGWIDHQLMTASLLNSKGQPDTKLFQHTPTNFPINGWIWQYFNLENDTSFTGAGFILGDYPTNNTVKMDYGYFLQPNYENKSWNATFILGNIDVDDYQEFPSDCNNPHSTPVKIPIKRDYKLYSVDGSLAEELALLFHPIEGQAIPWFNNGTFNNPDGSFCAEFPANFVSGNPNSHPNGVGYLESVGLEEVNQYRAYALSVLQGLVFETTE
ncbi:lipocalin-like domain-containing protein [Tenacibaculum sp. M341]|uniref:lipocalin-like domain-containing protein n=1 Tax=Tenacibaculum sp. M341 TaxID=2530339 RepID=UPI0010435001|nr:lipocalin-like domain-containing protein [Tenacibaculum sp. M341]TCI91316.1 hypothetical protein EYW44_10190 [Tenacibaculum sp. M341]